MNELTELCNKYKTDKGNKVFFENQDAPHEYSFIYEKFLKDRKFEVKSILEIGLFWRGEIRGVQDLNLGPRSLYVWRDYFPKAKVFGFDILDGTRFNEDRIKVIQGSQDSEKDLNNLADTILKDTGKADVVIDDGSHVISHIEKTYRILFDKLLKPGGYFFIEDLAPNSKSKFEFVKNIYKNDLSYSEMISDATGRNEIYVYRKKG